MNGDERRLLVDASVFITLAEIGYTELLCDLDGTIVVPDAVCQEISDDPAASRLEAAGLEERLRTARPDSEFVEQAAAHLGISKTSGNPDGDVALLASALACDDAAVVTDDKPLRNACKALGIDVSGSIGVLVVSVEKGELPVEDAKDALYAMDEVGARLSTSLVKRAERMIDEANQNGS